MLTLAWLADSGLAQSSWLASCRVWFTVIHRPNIGMSDNLKISVNPDSGGSVMTIRITFAGDAQERDLHSLTDWLRNEPAIRQHAKITIEQSAPKPGKMGTTLEAIQLAIGSGFQLANLALAIASWRRSGASKTTMVVNGTVMLDSTKMDSAQIARELETGGVENGAAES
jgi:Effector Associated Constant Component 1